MANTTTTAAATTVVAVAPATVAAAQAQLVADALALLAAGNNKTATAAIVAHAAGITGRTDKQLRVWLRDLLRTADRYAEVAAPNAKHLHATTGGTRKATRQGTPVVRPAAPAAPAPVAPPAAPAPDYRNLPLAALRKLAAEQGVGKTLAGKRCASSGKAPIIEALLAHHAAG